MKDTAGKGLKLVKAIASVPELPHLTFNANRVEYLFDDVKKQIETSPFAAKLREIDSGLKELGLAVPVNALENELLPIKDYAGSGGRNRGNGNSPVATRQRNSQWQSAPTSAAR
jgi:hypothetical protein